MRPHAELNRNQLARYEQDGYLVVPHLLTEREIATFLKDEPRIPSWGKAAQPLTRHKTESHWLWLATHPRISEMAGQLLHGAPRVVQSTYLRKEPLPPNGPATTGIGFHRDNIYIRTEPATLMACWIALNDTDAGNGGLCVVPGSHREEPHLRSNPALRCKGFQISHRMRDHNGRAWTSRFNAAEFDGVDPADVVQLKVRRGSAVFFSGNLIHGSYANHSPDRERLAAAVHYVKDGTWVFRIDLQDTMAVTDRRPGVAARVCKVPHSEPQLETPETLLRSSNQYPMKDRKERYTEEVLSKTSGSIAVVGNGELSCAFGPFIDGHDVVIRFNAFVLDGYEARCGRRVTHWCTFGETPDRPLPRRAGLRPLSPFKKDAPESQGINPKFRARIAFARNDYRLPCFGRPSTGIMLLWMLDALGLEADVFGFDGFLSGHYFNKTHSHDPDHLGTEFLYLATRPCFHVYMDDLVPCATLREDLPTLLKRLGRNGARVHCK